MNELLSAAELKEMYRDFAVQPITVKRYTGQGVNQPQNFVDVKGYARAYGSQELVGSIQQGDTHVVVVAQDFIDAQFALPLKASDKVVVAGKELAIIAPMPRRAPDGTLVAYELQCRG